MAFGRFAENLCNHTQGYDDWIERDQPYTIYPRTRMTIHKGPMICPTVPNLAENLCNQVQGSDDGVQRANHLQTTQKPV